MFNSDQERVSDLEQRLRSWVPSVGGLDRDRMLFEAGQAAGAAARARGMSRWWQFAAAAAAVLAMGLAWQTERRERLALQLDIARLTKPVPAPTTSTSVMMAEQHPRAVTPDRWSYLTLVRQVSRIEQGENLESTSTERTTTEKVEPTRSLRNAPLRPRDFERVIAL